MRRLRFRQGFNRVLTGVLLLLLAQAWGGYDRLIDVYETPTKWLEIKDRDGDNRQLTPWWIDSNLVLAVTDPSVLPPIAEWGVDVSSWSWLVINTSGQCETAAVCRAIGSIHGDAPIPAIRSSLISPSHPYVFGASTELELGADYELRIVAKLTDHKDHDVSLVVALNDGHGGFQRVLELPAAGYGPGWVQTVHSFTARGQVGAVQVGTSADCSQFGLASWTIDRVELVRKTERPRPAMWPREPRL